MTASAFRHIEKTTLKGVAIRELVDATSPGCNENALLRLSGNVAHGETFTISNVKYRLIQLNTAMQNLANNVLNNTKTGIIPGVVFAGAHGLSARQLFRVNNEAFRVVTVDSTTQVTVERGFAGTTVAAQASGQAALVAANYTGVDLVNERLIPLGATLTPAVAGPAIALAVNTFKQLGITATYLSTPTHVLFSKPVDGTGVTLAEAMANATIDAAFNGGVAKAQAIVAKVTRVPTAAEVTDGYLHAVFPFTVKHAIVSIRITATNAVKAWDGAVTISGSRVTLDNAGATDWAATDTAIIEAIG